MLNVVKIIMAIIGTLYFIDLVIRSKFYLYSFDIFQLLFFVIFLLSVFLFKKKVTSKAANGVIIFCGIIYLSTYTISDSIAAYLNEKNKKLLDDICKSRDKDAKNTIYYFQFGLFPSSIEYSKKEIRIKAIGGGNYICSIEGTVYIDS